MNHNRIPRLSAVCPADTNAIELLERGAATFLVASTIPRSEARRDARGREILVLPGWWTAVAPDGEGEGEEPMLYDHTAPDSATAKYHRATFSDAPIGRVYAWRRGLRADGFTRIDGTQGIMVSLLTDIDLAPTGAGDVFHGPVARLREIALDLLGSLDDAQLALIGEHPHVSEEGRAAAIAEHAEEVAAIRAKIERAADEGAEL